MGLEFPTHISQLVPSNPPGGDPIAQGDDHIRNIKQVLQNDFPNASKAFRFPVVRSISGNTTLTVDDQNELIIVDTGGGVVNVTLPTLGATDDGWRCTFMKIPGNSNPVNILSPSGNLFSGPLSLAFTRRCIPGVPFDAMWSGSTWIVERIERNPVGTILDFGSGAVALPTGYEYANGQTLGAAYPDFLLASGTGVTRDLRGRVVAGRDDMGGSAAGRLTNATMTPDGLTIGGVGGLQSVTLLEANLPVINKTPAGTITGSISYTPAGSLSGRTADFNPAGNIVPGVHAHSIRFSKANFLAGGGGDPAAMTTIAQGAGVFTDGSETSGTGDTFSGSATNANLSGGSATAAFTGTPATLSITGNATFAGTAFSFGGGAPTVNIQPTIILNKIIVVE